jgi:hypothetical protein
MKVLDHQVDEATYLYRYKLTMRIYGVDRHLGSGEIGQNRNKAL